MPYLHDDYIYQQVTVMVGFWQWRKCKARFTVLSIFLQIDGCPLRVDNGHKKAPIGESIHAVPFMSVSV